MRAFAVVAAAAVVASTISPFALAQELRGASPAAPASRPKVCLVLSGGGARGVAHVGVLKALEAMRIPIDCIAGTSMGAVIGGAYASGMETREMEKVIEGLSTQVLFREKPPRQDQNIRRKLDDRSILFGIELGLHDGAVDFPKGVVSGVQLESVLRQLVKTPGFRQFDELSIPYRAVATDLVSGKAMVFHEGELAGVMRASMSVPGAIAPAEIDGAIYVDGGLTDNLPVDVARTMGADIVIAVNLGTPLLKREELGSVFGVTGQMINILTEQNVRTSLASLKPTDILIEPALGDFSATDFDHLPDTVPIGIAAVQAVTARLAPLALPPERYAQLRIVQTRIPPRDARPIAEIRFRHLERVNPEAAVAELDTKAGKPLDEAVLDRDLRRLFGSGDFEHIGYRVIEESGRRVLDVDAVEKAWGPNYLRFGLGLASDLQGQNTFNAALSYRRTWINDLGGEWRSDLQIGQTSRFYSELYQPLDATQRLFVSPQVELERRSIDVFQASQRIARFDVRQSTLALDVGTSVTKYGEARAGILAGVVDASLDTGPPEFALPDAKPHIGAYRLRAIFDQLDSANFPRFGFASSVNVKLSSKSLGATDEYERWDADFLAAHSFGPHTFHVAAKAGGKLSGDALPPYDLFQWGGFLQQSGYPTGSLLGQRLAFGRVGYSYKLLNQRLLEGLYVGMTLEAGRVGAPVVPGNAPGLLKSTAVYLGADTPVGPFYLGFGLAADGSHSAYLFLGRP
jgi:NTE family protein